MADLSGVNLNRVDLSWVDLSGADLSGAKLNMADLSGVNLYVYEGELMGAKLGMTHLSKAKLSANMVVRNMVVRKFGTPIAAVSVPVGKLFHVHDAAPSLPSTNRAVRRIKAMGRRASMLLASLILRDWRRADPVDCTVFAPPSVARGDWLSVQVFAHRPDQAEDAKGLAQEIDLQARRRGFKSLDMEVKHGNRLTFHLCVPGIDFDASTETLVWKGHPDYVHFIAQAPPELSLGTIVGRVTVSLDNIPNGSIMFRLEIVEKKGLQIAPKTLLSDTSATQKTLLSDASATHRSFLMPLGDRIRRYKKAFISYATKDRPEVLKRVQMLRLARIRYFQDVLKLEPGDRWERKLYLHIDKSDLFLLFWSTNAKQSQWVLEEARYALKRKHGDDFAPPDLIPVIIEGPPVPEPPVELAHLHFNDYLVYFMVPPEATHQEEKP